MARRTPGHGPSPGAAADESSLYPATLLAFTDGAVERRGEDLDIGLERLRSTAAGTGALPLADLLDRLMTATAEGGGRDDTVILGLRWPTN